MTLSERLLNSVNLKPPQIEVKGSNIWKEKDMSKIEDLKTIEKTFDWTFSTPYKGTISSLSSVYDEINTREAQIDQILAKPSGDSKPPTLDH
jgi:hypothetical protein